MSVYSDDDGGMDDSFDSETGFASGDDALLDDEDDYAQTSAQDKEVTHDIPYESLSPKRLQKLIEDDISHVAAIVGKHTPIVAIMMVHYRWNQDRLIEKYMDSPDEVLRIIGEPANVPVPESPMFPPAKRARLEPRATQEEINCGICYDTPSAEDASALRCMHQFCNSCWEAHLIQKIKNEGQVLVPCMADGCKTIADEPSIKRLVDAACYDRWKELLHQSYVFAHPSLRFCPHPSCKETVSCPSGTGSALLTTVPTVTCGASHAFCFGCGLDQDHKPTLCTLATLWLKSAREDAGTSQWIKANTRACPKCQGIIEKGGGCNRMMCRHCQYMFCWMCMQKWDVHGYDDKVCSTWTEPPETDDMSEAKRNLDKWLFYFDRFNNHELSARLDRELLERSAERIKEVQDHTGMSWIEAQFLGQAVDELSRCRSTLMWTYAMAHFLERGNEKEIFEAIQADLEVAVEKLSQLLEEPIEEDTIKELRRNIMNKTVYVKQRHETVLKDTARRLHDGTLKWTVKLE